MNEYHINYAQCVHMHKHNRKRAHSSQKSGEIAMHRDRKKVWKRDWSTPRTFVASQRHAMPEEKHISAYYSYTTVYGV